METNVGANFLKLIDKHFPKSNPLSKIINRKTVKVSYRTTANMKNILAAKNKKLLRGADKSKVVKNCNCTKEECPLQGRCLLDNIVYQAKVETARDTQTYVGLSSTTFKLRYDSLKMSFIMKTTNQNPASVCTFGI